MKAARKGRAKWKQALVLGTAFAAAGLLATAVPAEAKKLSDLGRAAEGELDALMGLLAWVFYLLAAFCFGYAALKVKGHVDNPQRGGLTIPTVVFIIAIVLAAGPTLLERAVESFELDKDQQLQRPKF